MSKEEVAASSQKVSEDQLEEGEVTSTLSGRTAEDGGVGSQGVSLSPDLDSGGLPQDDYRRTREDSPAADVPLDGSGSFPAIDL